MMLRERILACPKSTADSATLNRSPVEGIACDGVERRCNLLRVLAASENRLEVGWCVSEVIANTGFHSQETRGVAELLITRHGFSACRVAGVGGRGAFPLSEGADAVGGRGHECRVAGRGFRGKKYFGSAENFCCRVAGTPATRHSLHESPRSFANPL